MTSLLKKYKEQIAPKLRDGGAYANAMQVPKVSKVVLNMGFNTSMDKDQIKAVVEDMTKIAGQKPVITKAKNSIANFKLREDMPVGVKLTLRGQRMYEFMDRLINIALPRIRDFRGISGTSFDGRGNYTFGLSEQSIFPEIDPDRIKVTQGMDITIVTTANSNEEAKTLLKEFGMPFADANA